MPDIRPVTDDFAVAPQLRPEDVPALAGRFRLLVNNRPDGESPDQPASLALRTAAEGAGLRYIDVPVTGPPTRQQVEDVRRALEQAGGPVLAFCKTGTRSIVTWAAGEALQGRPLGELQELGAGAGYDLAPHLQAVLPRISG